LQVWRLPEQWRDVEVDEKEVEFETRQSELMRKSAVATAKA